MYQHIQWKDLPGRATPRASDHYMGFVMLPASGHAYVVLSFKDDRWQVVGEYQEADKAEQNASHIQEFNHLPTKIVFASGEGLQGRDMVEPQWKEERLSQNALDLILRALQAHYGNMPFSGKQAVREKVVSFPLHRIVEACEHAVEMGAMQIAPMGDWQFLSKEEDDGRF